MIANCGFLYTRIFAFFGLLCPFWLKNSIFVETLAEDVAIRNLTLRDEDLEMFEDEPDDYMKRDIEGALPLALH